MTDTPNIWERLDTDTDKSFAAFCIYRDMGAKRSLDKVSQEIYGKSTGSQRYVEQWSTDNNWVNRVAAFDKYQDSLRQERNLERQKLIEDNAYEDYTVLRQAIAKYVRDYTSAAFKGIKPGDISNLASLMKQADDYARRAVGLPDRITESKNAHTGADGGAIRTENTHKFDPSKMSDDELRRIASSTVTSED
jgi:hypothetical protein